MFKKYQFRNYNFRLIILILIVSFIGVLVINSAKDLSFALKQFMGMGVGLTIMVMISLYDYNKILNYYWAIYIVNFVLLLAVFLFGSEKGGAKRWIQIGDGLSIQPSEFTKIFMILFTAKVITMFKSRLNTWKFLFVLGILLMIPVGFISQQPNLSTTLLLCMILFTIVYCAGLSYKKIGILFSVLFLFLIVVFIDIHQENPMIIRKYQVDRIMTFFDPNSSEDGVYQQKYSVQAIGSGQLKGKGLNNDEASSIKNAGYIAEAQTDFIFAVIGEELGFIGGCIVLLLLALIIFECILAAIRAKDFSGRLICCGMASLVAYQTFINVGVATQILPNTGIPLPLVSNGLSSLLALFGGMGIVINISLQRNSYDND